MRNLKFFNSKKIYYPSRLFYNFRAIAAPKISAIAVPIATNIAVDVIIFPIIGFMCLFIASEMQSPVTIPYFSLLIDFEIQLGI